MSSFDDWDWHKLASEQFQQFATTESRFAVQHHKINPMVVVKPDGRRTPKQKRTSWSVLSHHVVVIKKAVVIQWGFFTRKHHSLWHREDWHKGHLVEPLFQIVFTFGLFWSFQFTFANTQKAAAVSMVHSPLFCLSHLDVCCDQKTMPWGKRRDVRLCTPAAH